MSNYYLNKTTEVKDLMHFPYKSLEAFQEAIKTGEVVDIGVAMDHARSWAMQATIAPKLQKVFKNIIMLFFVVLPFFYIGAAFFMKNYWLIPFALVPALVFFTGSPMARKMFPLHWILLIGLGAFWLISGSFPHPIYWLPILAEYKGFDYLYKDSASLVRQYVQKDENTLILFWKHFDLTLYLKDGGSRSQRGEEKDGKYTHYEDVQEEWKEYLASKQRS